MIINLLSWIVFGLFAGFIARVLTPGRDPVGFFGTMLVGVVGSFVGGFLARMLMGGGGEGFSPSGFIGSVIGGIVVLLVLRQIRRPAAS